MVALVSEAPEYALWSHTDGLVDRGFHFMACVRAEQEAWAEIDVPLVVVELEPLSEPAVVVDMEDRDFDDLRLIVGSDFGYPDIARLVGLDWQSWTARMTGR